MGVEKVEGEYRGAKARVRRVARGCPRVFKEARLGSDMIDAGIRYCLCRSDRSEEMKAFFSARGKLYETQALASRR